MTQTLDDQEQFATLAGQYAVCGHALGRSSPAEGHAAFYAVRWGWVKPLVSLDAAQRFLAQIGGRS
jgi:hypothetical protein